ncbi:hypothetical protein B0H10DRAFT_1963293 [Mycena sp. CBHHK59/15]|nr:hypothetical protein B0H10DRAFT_1963293 [Mycena sp. CBHHK59/15]
MRRRRVLKLVPATCLLSFFALLLLSRPQELALDTVLDEVLNQYLHFLPDSASARNIRAVQRALALDEPPQSPRDFKLPEPYSSSHVAQVCASLRGKKILLVGSETTFYLHSLWLRALEVHEQRIHECPGAEFCTFHHICQPPGRVAPQEGRFKRPPTNPDLVASGSAIMRYALSTSLLVAKDKTDARYTQPVVDPATGVRLKNAYWLHTARKADIVVMNRGPIPAPRGRMEETACMETGLSLTDLTMPTCGLVAERLCHCGSSRRRSTQL